MVTQQIRPICHTVDKQISNSLKESEETKIIPFGF